MATDYPFDEVAKQAEEQVKLGHTVHQKFTCAGCGARQTIDAPNKFYYRGTCEECGHVTDIKSQGCNYLLIKEFKK